MWGRGLLLRLADDSGINVAWINTPRSGTHMLFRGSIRHIQSRLAFLPCPFKIRTMVIMVFQFRVVARTPNSLSIWPR
jgi:hypothetical protein